MHKRIIIQPDTQEAFDCLNSKIVLNLIYRIYKNLIVMMKTFNFEIKRLSIDFKSLNLDRNWFSIKFFR